MAVTYEAIQTVNGTGSSGIITFTSIPSTYTDLVLVASGTATGNTGWGIQFNSDTGSNYSATYLEGSGTTTVSEEYSAVAFIRVAWNSLWNTSTPSTNIINIQNYTNTSVYKTAIFRNASSSYIEAGVGLWNSASAINKIEITTSTAGSQNFSSSSTFTLYGVKSA